MITIDGAHGEGGGQIIRSSLALSLVTGTPFTIENVRAGRSKPGLLRQHLTAVNAATEIGSASTEGAELRSKRLVFQPNSVVPGNYRFSVGSAGSTTLVLQAILPALMVTRGSSTIEVNGGTHNPFAPPYDFLTKVYLPRLEQIGAAITAGECRPGFYPAGGGGFTVHVSGCPKLGSLKLLQRGKLLSRRVRAMVANLPLHIAERECKTMKRKTNWDAKCFVCESVDQSPGPGNVVMIELEFEHVTELFVAFGERGKKAERVANEVLRAAQQYLKADVPVGEYLADQLLLPLGLSAEQGASSVFRTGPLTQHSKTHIDILKRFLSMEIDVESTDEQAIVKLRPA